MTIVKGIILGLVVVALLGGIGATVYLVNQQQDIRSRAQSASTSPSPTTTATAAATSTPASSCQSPSQVTVYEFEYPGCNGSSCSSDQAACGWDAVSGATNYNIKVTEIESGKVIKEDTVPSSNTKYIFKVTAGNSYRCDVSAVNACGTGSAGSMTGVCKIEGSIAPSSTPAPTPPPSVTPISCGYTGCSATVPCTNGSVCVQTASGQNYCAIQAFVTACQTNPTIQNCCQPPAVATPTPQPQSLACGQSGCSETNPCTKGYVCVQSGNGQNYCALDNPKVINNCQQGPNQVNCCQVPPGGELLTRHLAVGSLLLLLISSFGLALQTRKRK